MTSGFGTGYVPQELDDVAVEFWKARDLAPMRAAPSDSSRTRKMWKHGHLLNQQQYPACCGFAWTGELTAKPKRDPEGTRKEGNAYGLNHYRRGVFLTYGANRYPDVVDKVGLSIKRGAEVARDRGLIEAFAWAKTLTEIRDAVVNVGPVVLGIPWYQSMTSTRDDGLIRVRPTDEEVANRDGGHAVVITGYDPNPELRGQSGPAFRIRNSWGTMWGADDPKDWRRLTGVGWLLADDLQDLLDVYYPRSDGSWYDTACLPLGRRPVDLSAMLEAHPDPTVS